MWDGDARALLRAMLHAAIDAADPASVVPGRLPPPAAGRNILIGYGKASVAMAQAFVAEWDRRGHPPLEGLIVAPHGGPPSVGPVPVLGAAHPVPDPGSLDAGRRMLDLLRGLSAQDQVIALVSGGGSSLLTLPPDGITPDDVGAVHRALLASGASISEMNCVRKHLCRIKGGRLARAAHPAPVISLVMSDIPGDDPALVSSGPTIADATTRRDALAIVARYRLDLPAAARRRLDDPAAEAPRPDDAAFANDRHEVIATAQRSLDAAAAVARQAGIAVHILSDAIEGEAADVGTMHAAIARHVAGRHAPFRPPCVLLSGGETTVTVRGTAGRGGRNTEFLLALAIGIDGTPGITAIAADTDGIDGTGDNAGAICDGATVGRLRDAALDPRDHLARHDSRTAFAALDDLVMTGPTRTNVNDFRAIHVG